MKDKYVKNCPFCGGTEMIKCNTDGYATASVRVSAVNNMWGSILGGPVLYHTICRNCGSVVRSYVKEPEKLLKRKDRR